MRKIKTQFREAVLGSSTALFHLKPKTWVYLSFYLSACAVLSVSARKGEIECRTAAAAAPLAQARDAVLHDVEADEVPSTETGKFWRPFFLY